ncbi:MAG TPA: hypothetical protein PLT86_08240 [Candidatus Latescibacteria bacterium]|nr:hypothetical protein [Candidatus Latescibacterota bacterium]HPC45946.1 hypothetical protein [Candidatus Latescibacterota bacterium]
MTGSMRSMCAVLAGAVLGAIVPVAGASPVSITADVSGVSHYFWRGYDLLGGAKLPVQPALTATAENGLSAGIWGSAALLDRSTTDAADELDFTVSYSRPVVPGIEASAGGTYYYLPNNTIASTAELFASAAFVEIPFEPTLTAYYDTKWLDDSSAEADGWYFLAAASHSVPVGRFSLDLSAGLGFGSNSTFTGPQDLTLRAATTIPVGRVKLTPFLSPILVFEDAVNSDTFGICGGVSVSYAF